MFVLGFVYFGFTLLIEYRFFIKKRQVVCYHFFIDIITYSFVVIIYRTNNDEFQCSICSS